MLVNELEKSLSDWAVANKIFVKEIYFIGSQSQKTGKKELSKSDIDILIILDTDEIPSSIYSELSQIGLQYSILIHPLIISRDEQELKLNIPEYRLAYEKGRIIYQKT